MEWEKANNLATVKGKDDNYAMTPSKSSHNHHYAKAMYQWIQGKQMLKPQPSFNCKELFAVTIGRRATLVVIADQR